MRVNYQTITFVKFGVFEKSFLSISRKQKMRILRIRKIGVDLQQRVKEKQAIP